MSDLVLPRTIQLKHCRMKLWDWGCETIFEDGTGVPSVPHDTPHYHVISHRCGMGDDLLAYCVTHDLMHNLVEERMHDRPSQVLWGLAHGRPLSGRAAVYEEIVAQAAQRWVWANERPVVSGVDWDSFKADALRLMDAA